MADSDNDVIRQVTYPEGAVTTFAGSTQGYRDGARLQAQFHRPRTLAMSGDGVLLVADYINNVVRKIAGDEVSTFAGYRHSGPDDAIDMRQVNGPALASYFYRPSDIAIDHKGNVLVTEVNVDDKIRMVLDTGLEPPLAHFRELAKAAVVDRAFSICEATTGVRMQDFPVGFAEVLENAQAMAEASCETRKRSRKLLHDGEHCGPCAYH